MKKLALAIFMCGTVAAFAQTAPTDTKTTAPAVEKTFDLKSHEGLLGAIKTVYTPVVELDAQNWAGKIKNGEMKFEAWKKFSAGWLMPEDSRKALVDEVSKLIADPSKIRPLTPEEADRYNTAQQQIRTFIEIAGESDSIALPASKMSKVDSIQKSVMKLEALYLADLIKSGKASMSGIEDASTSWVMKTSTRHILLARISELLDGKKIRKLTKLETGKLEAAHVKINAIIEN